MRYSDFQFERLTPRTYLSASRHDHDHDDLPRFDHIVVVVEQNQSYDDILGQSAPPNPLLPIIGPVTQSGAPYINLLARHGVSLTDARANAAPNFLDVISGLTSPNPTAAGAAPALWEELGAKGLSYANYSERKLPHEFRNLPKGFTEPFTEFPTDFTDLPTVATVMPSRAHDMHNSTVLAGDKWIKRHLSEYAEWARTHNSLLVIVWDQGHGSDHIPMILYGAHVRPQQYAAPADQYNLVRTITGIYRLPALEASAQSSALDRLFTDVN